MNILADIARRKQRLSKRHLPNRLTKFADSTGQFLTLSGGQVDPKSIDTRKMEATFVISTQDTDREGDTLISKGCRLDEYKHNPTVLWDHQSDNIPLGKAERDGQLLVNVGTDRVISTCVFHGKNRENVEIFELVDEGFIRGASVGFLPVPGKYRKNGTDGYTFQEWMLTEWTITPIGMNAGALRLHLDKGRIKSMSLRKRLEPFAATASRSWSNGVTLEKKAMADEYKDDDDDKEKDDDDSPFIEKADDDEPEETVDDPVDEVVEDEPAEETVEDELPEEGDDEPGADLSQKPGARALGMIAAAYGMLAEQIQQTIATNDHPKIVGKLQKLLDHSNAIKEEAEADLASIYPGVTPESVSPMADAAPVDDAPVDETPVDETPVDDAPMDDEPALDEEIEKKLLSLEQKTKKWRVAQ